MRHKDPDRFVHERAATVLAQGNTGTNSKRPSAYVEGVFPTHVVSGEGPYLIDAWGKKYIDMVSGLGTNILGYNHQKVVEAVIRQARLGASFSLPHVLEIEVGELICEMVPQIERVRFLKTGNEATLAAIRIARAATGKHIVWSEGYHGHGDLWTSLTEPATGVVDKFLITNEEPKARNYIKIVEPVELDAGDARKDSLGNLSSEAVLIYDEIVTGFRVPKYTVGNWWQHKPDITCLGKAIANGYPLSIVGGKKEIMNEETYFVSSTFSGEAVSLAACKATLEELQKRSMDDLYFYANRAQRHFNEICKPIGVSLKGYGTRAMFDTEQPNAPELMQELCRAGVILGKAWFYGFAHMEGKIDERFNNILSDCVGRIASGKVELHGRRPVSTFKR